ncbi:MAG: DUF6348 family protein, partial [Isosphaeraceae bacterium]
NVRSVQIDVHVQVEPDRVLVESFAGIGLTRDKAITDGLHNFVANSFHVLLAAFYRDDEDGMVVTDHWRIDDRPRRIIIGNIGVRGRPADPEKPPIEWFTHLESKIKTSSLSPGTHWVRCYYAQMGNQPTAVEVLLDNEDWGEVRAEMETVDWPKCEQFYSVRVFLIIQDQEG